MENLFNAKTPRFKIIGNYCPHWGPRATFNQATSLDKMHLKLNICVVYSMQEYQIPNH
jgi:hypothetical protein